MLAGKIVILMAGAAFFRREAVTIGTAADVHGVRVAVIALPGKISFRVAVHAARMVQHGDEGGEEGAIAGGGARRGRLGCGCGRKMYCESDCYNEDCCNHQARQQEWCHRMCALHTASVMRMGNRR